jgi:hypothetical protein
MENYIWRLKCYPADWLGIAQSTLFLLSFGKLNFNWEFDYYAWLTKRQITKKIGKTDT